MSRRGPLLREQREHPPDRTVKSSWQGWWRHLLGFSLTITRSPENVSQRCHHHPHNPLACGHHHEGDGGHIHKWDINKRKLPVSVCIVDWWEHTSYIAEVCCTVVSSKLREKSKKTAKHMIPLQQTCKNPRYFKSFIITKPNCSANWEERWLEGREWNFHFYSPRLPPLQSVSAHNRE